jgi:hypothetical protein
MDDLQFDKAEYSGATSEAPPTVCAPCQNVLAGEYFHVNEQPFCATCKTEVEQVLGGSPGPAGFVKAALGGVGGGIAGALLYYLVLALTGYEIGIIAIAVGFLVGKGVRWGTGNRGGRLYQAMAVGLTYVAIVSTYVPAVVRGLREADTTPPSASAPVERAAVPGSTPAAAPAATPAVTPAATASPGGDEPITPVAVFVGLAVFAVLILALPFLGGFANILGLVIIGIGVYEAWKINRRVPLVIAGPFPAPALAPTAFPPPVPAMPGP